MLPFEASNESGYLLRYRWKGHRVWVSGWRRYFADLWNRKSAVISSIFIQKLCAFGGRLIESSLIQRCCRHDSGVLRSRDRFCGGDVMVMIFMKANGAVERMFGSVDWFASLDQNLCFSWKLFPIPVGLEVNTQNSTVQYGTVLYCNYFYLRTNTSHTIPLFSIQLNPI